jgi:hypothetical protein
MTCMHILLRIYYFIITVIPFFFLYIYRFHIIIPTKKQINKHLYIFYLVLTLANINK